MDNIIGGTLSIAIEIGWSLCEQDSSLSFSKLRKYSL